MRHNEYKSAEILAPSNSELLCFRGFTIMQEKNNVCRTEKMRTVFELQVVSIS